MEGIELDWLKSRRDEGNPSMVDGGISQKADEF
jgi:hypothetical protein